MRHKPVEPLPRHIVLPGSAVQPFAPRTLDLLIEAFEAVHVTGDSVISIMTMKLSTQCSPLFFNRQMAVYHTPLINSPYCCCELLACCFTPDHPAAFPRLSPIMGKSEKTEHTGAFPFALRAAKIQQPALGLMDRKTMALEPFSQNIIYPLGVTLVAEHQNKVSSPGESHPQALSEPGVNLSAHRAPIIQPTAKSPFSSARTAGVRDERSAPANTPPGVYGD